MKFIRNFKLECLSILDFCSFRKTSVFRFIGSCFKGKQSNDLSECFLRSVMEFEEIMVLNIVTCTLMVLDVKTVCL